MNFHSVGYGNDDNNEVDQSLANRQYAVVFDSNLGATPYSENFAHRGLLSPATGPQQISTGSSNQRPYWSTTHQSSISEDIPELSAAHGSGAFYMHGSYTQGVWDHQSAATSGGHATYMTESANQPFPGGHFYNAEQIYGVSSPFPSMPGNAYAGNWSDHLGYQFPLSPENESAAQTPDSLAFVASPSTTTHITRSPLYVCLECPDEPAFGTLQDLNRHRTKTISHRTEATKYYQCACGRICIERKDNYCRHVRTCNFPATGTYVCICNEETRVKEEHVAHVEHCGRRRYHRGARRFNAH